MKSKQYSKTKTRAGKHIGVGSLLRPLGVPLIGEGVGMLACLIPAFHYADGSHWGILAAGLITAFAGLLLLRRLPRHRGTDNADRRSSFITVTLMWVVMCLFGALPFLLAGVRDGGSVFDIHFSISLTDAVFESFSGLTTTGATILADVEALPPSLLLWRSLSQWLGGFGIILLVLAVVPSLGLNKYALYAAETSSADNSGKTAVTMSTMVRQTLVVYLSLTALFIILLMLSGMTLWEAVNLTFTNISTGGFSIYSDSIARFTPLQQYLLAASMFVGGINFALLYNFFTFRWSKIKRKLDQFVFYLAVAVVASAFVMYVLHSHHGYGMGEALRLSVVQTLSVLTTTGSVVADTRLWWTPVVFLFLLLCLCGGMAGSTTGGVKVMRVLIMFRSTRNMLANRLHPHAYNPVRLNGSPVSKYMITNVTVTFFVFIGTLLMGLLALLLCGVNANEALGAVFGCVSGYGPGLGDCGGFGSYTLFPPAAKWICCLLMLLGRLECLTVLILLLPSFWKRW